MRKLLLTGAAAAAIGMFAAANAQAADLYVPPPPPPAPVWSWTGPYAGLHVGAVDGDIDDNLSEFDIVGDSMDPNGIMGGIQAGYNFQFDSIVLGIEGDLSLGDVDDTIYPGFARMEAQIDWMATIRGRLGWAWDRTLFYATGGIAFTDLEIKLDLGGPSDKDKNSYLGWTVGGGVEHAVTDNISLKAEYLYADFGKENFDFSFGGGEFEPNGHAKLKTHTFRVGVNYLF